jgi:hypothetical protein
MGHADIATTMIYVHHVPQLDAADRLSTALAQAARPAGAPARRGRPFRLTGADEQGWR